MARGAGQEPHEIPAFAGMTIVRWERGGDDEPETLS